MSEPDFEDILSEELEEALLDNKILTRRVAALQKCIDFIKLHQDWVGTELEELIARSDELNPLINKSK